MYITILICSLITLSNQNIAAKNGTSRKFIYNTYKYDQIIDLTVDQTTEQVLDFEEDSQDLRIYPTRVHVSTSTDVTEEYPLFITATQQKGVSSWELPLSGPPGRATQPCRDMARTLCPYDAGPNITHENRPLIHISTSNPKNVSVDIKVRRVTDFYVDVYKETVVSATPATPKYYYFSFDKWNVSDGHVGVFPRINDTKSVTLMIESKDELCSLVSIQNNTKPSLQCPVFDSEEDVKFQGYHLTMTTKGGITLTQSKFPYGFYIVFIVKHSDEDCTGEAPVSNYSTSRSWMWQQQPRNKTFTLRVLPTISYQQYMTAVLVYLGALSVIALFALVVYIPTCKCTEEVLVSEAETGPSTSRVDTIRDDDDGNLLVDASDSGSDLDPSEAPRTLTVAVLSRCRDPASTRRSNRYFWSALTVAVVYALPVVQLLSTYQQMVMQTGNQDLCYYNFLCAHPLGFLSDLNHVYSNVGYVILGLVFMLQTRLRQLSTRRRQECGIPEHHGLFYSMGLALVMEGVLSGCYHLCPNKMNFQFDSSFMYVIAVLCMVKIYQNRHPDINASAHATFMLLAFIMAIGLLGIMYSSRYFMAMFTVLHILTCTFLTLKIYYVGRFKLEGSVARRAWVSLRTQGRHALTPSYPARAVLLCVANAANWALAVYGIVQYKGPEHTSKDFAKHLLAILMGNTILYALFYLAMKLVHRERVPVHTWVYFALAHLAWFLALRLFLDSKTKWSETPAMSRTHNAACSALQFYDSHDLWHGASAAAMFLSFNMLLTVDDDLVNTPRHEIPVF